MSFQFLLCIKKHLDSVLAEGIADHLNVVNVDDIDGGRLDIEERVVPHLKPCRVSHLQSWGQVWLFLCPARTVRRLKLNSRSQWQKTLMWKLADCAVHQTEPLHLLHSHLQQGRLVHKNLSLRHNKENQSRPVLCPYSMHGGQSWSQKLNIKSL